VHYSFQSICKHFGQNFLGRTPPVLTSDFNKHACAIMFHKNILEQSFVCWAWKKYECAMGLLALSLGWAWMSKHHICYVRHKIIKLLVYQDKTNTKNFLFLVVKTYVPQGYLAELSKQVLCVFLLILYRFYCLWLLLLLFLLFWLLLILLNGLKY
jgi:hypothetical protein